MSQYDDDDDDDDGNCDDDKGSPVSSFMEPASATSSFGTCFTAVLQ
jgi:hypothetical protein